MVLEVLEEITFLSSITSMPMWLYIYILTLNISLFIAQAISSWCDYLAVLLSRPRRISNPTTSAVRREFYGGHQEAQIRAI